MERHPYDVAANALFVLGMLAALALALLPDGEAPKPLTEATES